MAHKKTKTEKRAKRKMERLMEEKKKEQSNTNRCAVVSLSL